jgi:DNA-binding NarL/FixJ family response regulator
VIRVLLVDDHTLLREGTRALLETDDELEIIGETGAGEHALSLARQLRPHVMLLDIRLQGLSGVEVARTLRHEIPEIKIIVLTAYDHEQYVRALFAIGVDGYLLKLASAHELVQAVRAVHAGDQVVSPDVSCHIFAQSLRAKGPAGNALSDRELEVLVLVSRGDSNKEIARALGVTTRTVEAHVSSLLGKLGARCRTEAINIARQRGVLE